MNRRLIEDEISVTRVPRAPSEGNPALPACVRANCIPSISRAIECGCVLQFPAESRRVGSTLAEVTGVIFNIRVAATELGWSSAEVR